MKIYEGEDDGVIGEFRYQTVEFDQTELVANGGVISQGAAQRYLAKERPDLKIKKCGSFKLDSQANTVTMRFAVPKSIVKRPSIPGGSKTLLNDCSCQDQKLLNPGYNELAAQVKGLKEQLELGAEVYDELQKQLDDVRLELSCPETMGMDNEPLYKWAAVVMCKELELHRKYDALVVAVGRDDQKFSDLLVENEELNSKNNDLTTANSRLREEITKLTLNQQEIDLSPVDKEALKIGEDILQIRPGECDELKTALETIEGGGDDAEGIVGPEIGDKELKDIAKANAEEPHIEPMI